MSTYSSILSMNKARRVDSEDISMNKSRKNEQKRIFQLKCTCFCSNTRIPVSSECSVFSVLMKMQEESFISDGAPPPGDFEKSRESEHTTRARRELMQLQKACCLPIQI